MLRILISILILIRVSCLSSSAIEDELDIQIINSLSRPESERNDRSWLTDEVRPVVIERLLRQLRENEEAPQGPNNGIRIEIEERLVRMGHEETIKRLVDEIDYTGTKGRALTVAGVDAIPYFMPLVYNGAVDVPPEPPMEPGAFEPTIYIPVRRTAINFVLRAIYDSEDFPIPTRVWAEKMLRGIKIDDEEWVALLTGWWEHNREMLLERRYGDATWLPRNEGGPMFRGRRELRELDALRAQHQRPSKRSGGDGVQDTPENDRFSEVNRWILFSSGVAAIGGILYRLIKKKA